MGGLAFLCFAFGWMGVGGFVSLCFAYGWVDVRGLACLCFAYGRAVVGGLASLCVDSVPKNTREGEGTGVPRTSVPQPMMQCMKGRKGMCVSERN